MHRFDRYFFAFSVLCAALAAPLATRAAARPQNSSHQEENRNRVYDRAHNDYHNWDDNEDRSYRQYLGQQHRDYRPIAETNAKQQRAYWNWRHSHPDHDGR
jgi:hypothetical protein